MELAIIGIILLLASFLIRSKKGSSSKRLKSEQQKLHKEFRKLESKGTEQGRKGRRIMKRDGDISSELMKRRNKK